jgi:lycopene cyclase domain-containing protein
VDRFLYLTIDLLSVLMPFAFSFMPQANFSKKWRFLWPGITITGVLFIVWDMAFTKMGVWGFNPRYVTGLYIYNLPIEEVLFFICIPYSSVFLYEALNYFIKRDVFKNYTTSISIMLVMFLLTMGFMNMGRWYTGVTFIACAIFIALNQWKWKAPWLSRFYFSYLFVLIPFFIVNGILTGSFIDQPVVWYNESEMLGIRMVTIPFEDTFYGMLMLMMTVAIFENRQHQWNNAS